MNVFYFEREIWGEPHFSELDDEQPCVIKDGITGIVVNDSCKVGDVLAYLNYWVRNSRIELDRFLATIIVNDFEYLVSIKDK